MPIDKYERLKQQGETFCSKRYKYKDGNRDTCIKFHVDDGNHLTKMGSKTPFGGYLSVCKPKDEKPLIIFGQDECIYKQFIFCNKCRMRPKGESQLTPKDEGEDLIVSGFVSREYEFDWKLIEQQLQKVNNLRKDKEYIDKEASISKFGKSVKSNLNSSPFIHDLEYVANNE